MNSDGLTKLRLENLWILWTAIINRPIWGCSLLFATKKPFLIAFFYKTRANTQQVLPGQTGLYHDEWMVQDRGGVKDTRLEAKAKDTKKSEAKAKDNLSEDRPSRGQGQECRRPRPKTKNTSASALQKKKRSSKKFFRRSQKKKKRSRQKFFKRSPQKKRFPKNFSSTP